MASTNNASERRCIMWTTARWRPFAPVSRGDSLRLSRYSVIAVHSEIVVPSGNSRSGTVAEITFPLDLSARRVAERLSNGNRPPIRSLLRRLAESISAPRSGPAPTELAKQLRQVRSKVQPKGKLTDDSYINARLELHVPPTGFGSHEVQRLLVMFAGVTRPRSVPYALRLVFDDPQDSGGDV